MFFNKCEHFYIIKPSFFFILPPGRKKLEAAYHSQNIIRERESKNLPFKCESNARKRIQNAVIHAKAIKKIPSLLLAKSGIGLN